MIDIVGTGKGPTVFFDDGPSDRRGQAQTSPAYSLAQIGHASSITSRKNFGGGELCHLLSCNQRATGGLISRLA